MFAGVGPYSILLAKSKKPAKVIAIDKNPDAVYYLKENISLNSVKNIEAIKAMPGKRQKGLQELPTT